MSGASIKIEKFYFSSIVVIKLFFFSIRFLFLLSSFIYSTNVPEYVNLRQPNAYTFIARGEGDEFLNRFKTLDNFTIIYGANDWWYYAYQGTDGKLYPTQFRVGIEDDNAFESLSENINYSQSIIDAANLQRSNFNANLTIQPVGPISIGVILIDFPDRIATRIDPQYPNDLTRPGLNSPANSSWQKRYSMDDFQELFFSTNTYNQYSPDGFPVYGSLNDYWKEVSYNQVNLTGAILNNQDNGKPIWYRASLNSTSYNRGSLTTEAVNKAIAAGFPVNSYSKICVIFAGPWGSNLWASGGGSSWWMGERNIGWDLDIGFASIGVHAHEFGHTVGLSDLYDISNMTCGVGSYSLMGSGNYGADLKRHSRPSHLLAYEKIRLGYITPAIIEINQSGRSILNIEENDVALKVKLVESGSQIEYFLIENRQPIGFDAVIPIGGILITHYFSDGPWFKLDIEEVGGVALDGCGIQSNLYPLDFYHRPSECGDYSNSRVESADFLNLENQVFSPWSRPNSNRWGSSQSSDVAIAFNSQNGSTCYIDVYKTTAINAPPSKPPLGFFHAGDGPIQYGWAYLAWGADYFFNRPIEPDVNWSELQRKIGNYGTWQTVYSGSNRWWSDNSIIYDPQNGDVPVYFRVRVRDSQNKWSIWSDLYDTRTFSNQNSTEKVKSKNIISNLPTECCLSTNYPNPFNPGTIINFAVKDAGFVSLKVYDILGSEVATLVNETKEAGNFAVEFNAANLPSGVYIYTLQVNDFTSSKKMLLMK